MRILFAEDERSLSRAVSTLLKRNHYEVDAVYDGTDALSHLENVEYDGVILDIMMPGMDGVSVLKAFRATGAARAPSGHDTGERHGLLHHPFHGQHPAEPHHL